MRFLLDQNLSPQTATFLRSKGLDAIDVREVGLAGKTDDEIYKYALTNKQVIITFDHEFGYKFTSQRDLEGLILLRIHPQTIEIIHKVLENFFTIVSMDKIYKSIIVLELGKFRIRKIRNGDNKK